jgi:CheY-like chemotaxis protein
MSSERPLIGIIEDDPIMGESLTQCLELEGYQVVRWRTGREAVVGLEKQLPDLVICDIRLPDISDVQIS